MIGAGLPLFQRLKLLRQRELEKEKQQQQEQEALLAKTEDAETIRSLQQVSVALLETTTDGVGGKSTPPPPPSASSPPSQARDDKQARHISFVDETNVEKKRDYVPVDPPKTRGKSARWTLPRMVGRANETSTKINKSRLSRLNTINQASSSSSAIDSIEQAEPPPLPPPLPPPSPL